MQRHMRLVGATGGQQQQQQRPQMSQGATNPVGTPAVVNYYSEYPPLQSPREKAVKYMMLIHEVFVMMIAGIIVLGLGAYTATQTTIVNSVCDMLGVYYHIATYALMIITGCTMLLVSVIGLVGTVKNSACLHLLYLIVLICLLVTFIAVGIVGFVFYTALQDAAKTSMEASITKYYGISQTVDRNKLVTDATDAVQSYFSCCGAYGGVNSTHSWFLYQNATAWYQVNTVLALKTAPYVPSSCCSRRADSSFQGESNCQGQTPIAGAPPVSPPPVVVANAALFTTGCFDAMQSFVSGRVVIAGAVGVAYFVLLLFGVILGFVFARFIAVADFYGSKYASFDNSGGGVGVAGNVSTSSPSA